MVIPTQSHNPERFATADQVLVDHPLTEEPENSGEQRHTVSEDVSPTMVHNVPHSTDNGPADYTSHYQTNYNYGTSNAVHYVVNGDFAGSGPVTNHIDRIEAAYFPTGSEGLLWDTLPKRPDISRHRNEYLENSREVDVQGIWGWIEDPGSELVLYIHGAAGLGKSTLARHLAQRLGSKGQLAAAIFLNDIPNDARGPESVVKMIAREIGVTHHEAIPLIIQAVGLCNGASVREHIEKYICNPICFLNRSAPLVVILDAIDEWEFHDLLIKELPYFNSSSSSLKLILLGRSDPGTGGFDNPCIRPYHLRSVPVAVMEQYFSNEFDTIAWEYGRRPTPQNITLLAEHANGLFMWSRIVCCLLKKRFSRSSPNETLGAILHSRRKVGETGSLPTLYHDAISWLFPDTEDQDLLRSYLGAVLALQEPLTIADFSSFTGLPVRTVNAIQSGLKTLHVRQYVDMELMVYPAITAFHLSFVEYLQSTSLPPSLAFSIHPLSHHLALGKACLLLLKSTLPSTRSLDFRQLAPRCRYSVKYWPLHFARGTTSVKPGTQMDRKHSSNSDFLNLIPVDLLRQWGKLFIEIVKPGKVVTKESYAQGQRACLMRDVALSLKSGDAAVRPFQVSCLEMAVRLEPNDVEAWYHLGWVYGHVAQNTVSGDALQKAVDAHRNALQARVDSTGDEGIDQAELFFSLATSLTARFKHIPSIEDLDEAIELHEKALLLRPHGHPSRSASLNNLAISLKCRSERTGSIADLNESTRLHRLALELRPPGHPLRSMSLSNTAASLGSSFEQTRSIGELEEAIRFQREALELRPPEHPDRWWSLHNLARSLQSLFEETGSIRDLREAVVLRSEALKLRPTGHPDRPLSLNALGYSLRSYFEQTSGAAQLEEAIRLHREALELSPPGHTEHVWSLHNLGYALCVHHEQTGSIEDLEEAIRLQREALELRPPGQPYRSSSLNLLTYILTFKYKACKSTEELQEAILLGRECLATRPVGHSQRLHILDTLATALHFQPEYIAEALELGLEAVSLTPPNHSERMLHLMNLATVLLFHYRSSGNAESLEEAISTCRQALLVCPQQHYRRSKLLQLEAKLERERTALRTTD
ncbi:hypothetical protein NMY22_g4805 [Coprinellus aureogranulatus]|nr:hypothetical protein NMY22_g4805 [Coprinellus aureogranulatus]